MAAATAVEAVEAEFYVKEAEVASGLISLL